MATSDETTLDEFEKLVNMTPKALERWLATPESRDAGQRSAGGGESTGHASGRRIVSILEKKRADYSDDDVAHAHKVVSYIKRHLAQKPAHPDDSRWEASLKNWGHDPRKHG